METKPQKPSAENFAKDIRRKARRLYSSQAKDTYCHGGHP